MKYFPLTQRIVYVYIDNLPAGRSQAAVVAVANNN